MYYLASQISIKDYCKKLCVFFKVLLEVLSGDTLACRISAILVWCVLLVFTAFRQPLKHTFTMRAIHVECDVLINTNMSLYALKRTIHVECVMYLMYISIQMCHVIHRNVMGMCSTMSDHALVYYNKQPEYNSIIVM